LQALLRNLGCYLAIFTLKGLSHEIDFKNFDKITELGLTKGRGWFFNFLGAPMILNRKKYIYCG
jgi:hypothetical protein